MRPTGVAPHRFTVAVTVAAAAILVAVSPGPLAATTCGHDAAGERTAIALPPEAAPASALQPATPPSHHCGHCAPGTCAAAVACGVATHARPAAPYDAFAAGRLCAATPPDRSGPRTTDPPPDTPPPQPRS